MQPRNRDSCTASDRRQTSALILSALLAGSGCLSPRTPIPLHYYMADGVIEAALATRATAELELMQVDADGAVRDSLTLRDGIELFYDEEHRWTGPPSDMVRRALADILTHPTEGPASRLTIAIEIFAIELPTNEAHMVLRARRLPANGRPQAFSVEGRSKAESPAPRDRMQALARAAAAALEALLDKLGARKD